MALVVTPGAANADAFATVDAVTAYCEDMGITDWTGAARSPVDDDEAAIRRATRWLSTAFSWKGTRTNARSQALAWPRTDVEDAEGETVDPDTIPTEIVQACCVAAAYERANPGGLTPEVDMTARVKAERVGPLSTEYFSAPMNAQASRPVLLAVREIVGGLVAGSANPLVGTSARA